MKDVLSRTRQWKKERTGHTQTTGFTAIDAAVAKAVNDVFATAVMIEPRAHELRFEAFLKREPEDRVFVGKFDDVLEFLKAVRLAGAGRRSIKQEVPNINRDALPLINLSRGFDVTYDNGDQEIDRHQYADFVDDDGKPLAEIEATQASLNYTVMLIASDKDTLSLLCNTFAANLRSRLTTSFEANDILVRVPVKLNCNITDAKSIMFGDMSPPFTQERIYACSAGIIILADVLTAHEVESTSVRYDMIMNHEAKY